MKGHPKAHHQRISGWGKTITLNDHEIKGHITPRQDKGRISKLLTDQQWQQGYQTRLYRKIK